jgi:hypothetical protein
MAAQDQVCSKDKSAAIFCRLVATRVPDPLNNFCLVKNNIIANNSTATEASLKNRHIFGIF